MVPKLRTRALETDRNRTVPIENPPRLRGGRLLQAVPAGALRRLRDADRPDGRGRGRTRPRMRVERLDLHQPRGAELDHRDAPAGGPGRRLGPKSRRAGRLVLPGQGGTGRQVDGGLVLNGTWSFASGIDFADWENLQVSIRKEQGPPDHRFVLVPKTDFTIEDDW